MSILSYSGKFVSIYDKPESMFAWRDRDVTIRDGSGASIFHLPQVSFPEGWSQNAVNIVASKYFRDGERSLSDLVRRVVDAITAGGVSRGYFVGDQIPMFQKDLSYILMNQMASFNSPVWFNVGVHQNPQSSACFIQSVEDSVEGIHDLAAKEAIIFKRGSGTGTNFSAVRGQGEPLSGGGTASGVVSFLRLLDSGAGVIKSGGTTRRSAKMNILNVDHPDIIAFIESKVTEEKKARALVQAGFTPAEAYDTLQYQNANHSVSVTDTFMLDAQAMSDTYESFYVTGGYHRDFNASEILNRIAVAAWECGDPGLFFSGNINDWHTAKTSGDIVSSNPCGEYLFLNETACNLSSINLAKFWNDNDFDVEAFCHVVDTMVIAQDILVSISGYPTDEIAGNSRRYRTLGLGYSNLGGLLMSAGIPYDSRRGRNLAAMITALMTGRAYKMSASLAKYLCACSGYGVNKDHIDKVISMHTALVRDTVAECWYDKLANATADAWTSAELVGRTYGYRNMQVTVLAPTGTISFMMDCDTTGIEPAISLASQKNLDGGGVMDMTVGSLEAGLRSLWYPPLEVDAIIKYVSENGTVVGAPHILEEHYDVFQCALGDNTVSPFGHIKMMAEVQPFLSGGISKTVNLPNSATPQDIRDIYEQAWGMGLKAISVYRDGCKQMQPLESVTSDAPMCYVCNIPTVRSGSCHTCKNCGMTTSCG